MGGAKTSFFARKLFLSGGTESPENFKGGSVRKKRKRKKGYKPPEGSPEFFSRCTVLRGLQPSEAKRGRSAEPRSEAVRPGGRAKRGFTERSEAPPRLRRAKRGRARVIGRSPLHEKNSTKKVPPESPGEPLISGSFLGPRGPRVTIFCSNSKPRL